jgi:glycosyltransferase involved in cell wall biosynthesis
MISQHFRGSSIDEDAKVLTGTRVLAALNGLELFGHERGNIEVFKALRDSGAQILVMASQTLGGGDVAVELRRLGFEIGFLPFNPQWSIKFLKKHPTMLFSNPAAVIRCSAQFRRAIRRFRATHIHLGSPLAYSYLSIALATSRVPLIYRMGDAPPVDSRFNLPIWKAAIRRSSTVVANAEFLRTAAIAAGADGRKFRVIYPFAPTRTNGATTDEDARPAPERLVYVGSVAAHKGLLPLVEAIAVLARERQGIQLDICGGSRWDAPFREQLRERIECLGISNRVHFHGHISDPAMFYRRAAVHVAPTLVDEPAGNVVLEAKREGTPSVIFPSGGMIEMVRHQVDGYICESKTSADLVKALRWMLADRERLALMKSAALADHRDRFNHERFTRQWTEVYGNPSPARFLMNP